MASSVQTALRARREQIGLKPVQLAVAANVSLSYLYFLEAGRNIPGLDVARRLASALDCDIDLIFPAQERVA